MRRAVIGLLAALLLTVMCAAYAAAEEKTAGGEAERAEWTVMFYICGSDLESKYGFASGNLREINNVTYPDSMPYVYSSENAEETKEAIKAVMPGKVNVLIETGGSKRWNPKDDGMDFSAKVLQRWQFDCISFYEDFSGEKTGIRLLENCPLASMSDPATLADFIRWGAETCPAEKYALVLWDHGGGALNGLFIDELFDGDVMYLHELKQALADSGVYLEALVIDACLMANLETAWAVKDSAHWMVASEEVVPGSGTAVGSWLRELYTHPACDGKQLGRTICDMTQIKYAGEEAEETQSIMTWSVIDLTKTEQLVESLERFFREVSDAFARNTLLAFNHAGLFRNTEEYGDGRQKMRDLASLFYNEDAAKNISIPTRNEVIEALSDMVVYSVRGASRSKARGLSFCYPTNAAGSAMDIYAQICPSNTYLAYLDAITDWTAPDEVYGKTERLPEFSTIDDYRIYAEKRMTSDGFPAVLIEKYYTNISGVYYRLYYRDPATDEVVCLGRTNCRTSYVEETAGSGALAFAYEPWQWPCLNGIPCSMDMLIETNNNTGNVVMYGIPVQIGTETRYLRCGRIDYWNAAMGREYVVYGMWEEYNDSNQMADRSAIRLTELLGREYRLLWLLGVPRESANIQFVPAGPIRNITRSLIIKEETLPAGTYYLEYEADDMFMNPHVMERIEYYWDGEKVILPDGFTWEGRVLLN